MAERMTYLLVDGENIDATLGSSVLPAFTPKTPPQPISTNAFLSKTSTVRPLAVPSSAATSDIRVAVRRAGGVLARSRATWVASAVAMPRATPLRAAAARRPSTTSVTVPKGVTELSPFKGS